MSQNRLYRKLTDIVSDCMRGKKLDAYLMDLVAVTRILIRAFSGGNRVYICGNGGSCADASHIAGEFVKNFKCQRRNSVPLLQGGNFSILSRLQRGFPVYALTDSACMSAISNDMDFLLAFAQLVYVYGRKNDILIVLSTSGKSQNILNAVQTARKIGMYTICITGDRATKLTEMSNMVLHIQSNQTDTIQETYLAAFHVICQAVERAVYADSLRIHKKI